MNSNHIFLVLNNTDAIATDKTTAPNARYHYTQQPSVVIDNDKDVMHTMTLLMSHNIYIHINSFLNTYITSFLWVQCLK